MFNAADLAAIAWLVKGLLWCLPGKPQSEKLVLEPVMEENERSSYLTAPQVFIHKCIGFDTQLSFNCTVANYWGGGEFHINLMLKLSFNM